MNDDIETAKKCEEIYVLMNVAHMTLTEINTLTDKERLYLTRWFLQKYENEQRTYREYKN